MIVIKDMEMPKACLACDFCNPFTEEPYCRRLMKVTPKTTTLPDCPLIELPPHGRLIDADELLALVYANIALFDSMSGRQGADQKLVRAWLASMAEDINDAPTIIPAKEET